MPVKTAYRVNSHAIDRGKVFGEVSRKFGTEVRGISMRRKEIIIASAATTEEDMKSAVGLCKLLKELSDPKALAELMKIEVARRNSEGLENLPSVVWGAVAEKLVTRHEGQFISYVYIKVKSSLKDIPYRILDTEPAGDPFKTYKDTINLDSDPSRPYALSSVCPVSGMIRIWAGTYFEAIRDPELVELLKISPSRSILRFGLQSNGLCNKRDPLD
jgi:hypothetical protein